MHLLLFLLIHVRCTIRIYVIICNSVHFAFVSCHADFLHNISWCRRMKDLDNRNWKILMHSTVHFPLYDYIMATFCLVTWVPHFDNPCPVGWRPFMSAYVLHPFSTFYIYHLLHTKERDNWRMRICQKKWNYFYIFSLLMHFHFCNVSYFLTCLFLWLILHINYFLCSLFLSLSLSLSLSLFLSAFLLYIFYFTLRNT